MKTLKDWRDYKKKNAIPDGAVDGVSFGPALEKCQKIVDSDKGQPDKLKAVNDFWKVFKRYSTELDAKTKPKAKKFLDDLREEMEEVEKVSFEEAAKRADGKGKVVNLDPGDKVIDPASKSIAEKRKMGADAGLRRAGQTDPTTDAKSHDAAVKEDEADFSKATNEPIVILAHGTPIGKPGSGKVRATHFAGKKAPEITDFIAKTLDKTYYGVVYLDGCYTAAGNSPKNFAQLVYDGLVKKGYSYLQIKGNLGVARTVDGKEFVTPAELDDEYKALEEEQKAKQTEADKLLKPFADLMNKYTRNRFAITGTRKDAELTPDELKQVTKIDEDLDKVNKTRAEHKKLNELDDRVKTIKGILENEMTIEAATVTFGPERLPPKK